MLGLELQFQKPQTICKYKALFHLTSEKALKIKQEATDA
jgi:hypothetical protein